MRALSPTIARLIDQAAGNSGVDRFLARAVAWVESRGDSRAVSSKGAKGVMQLMPATAEHFGVSDPFDAGQNIRAGVRYLAELLRRTGSKRAALASYVWGPTNVKRTPAEKDWPEKVRTYVDRVLARQTEEREALVSPASPSAGDWAGLAGIGVVSLLGVGLLYLGLQRRRGP